MSEKNNIKLLYIDDDRDEAISSYLENDYKKDNCNIVYTEIAFNGNEGYESLLNSPDVTSANVILIDSKLFENNNIKNKGKFSGEEFRILLLTKYPFIEVMVISQNGEDNDLGVIPKYRHTDNENARSYYNRILKPQIDQAINKEIVYRNILKKLENNGEIERVLVERTADSVNGIDDYAELSKEDIDRLILAFQEVSETNE